MISRSSNVEGQHAFRVVAFHNHSCLPFGELLAARPHLGYVFGYGHIPEFTAIAEIGAGLRITGHALAGDSSIRSGKRRARRSA